MRVKLGRYHTGDLLGRGGGGSLYLPQSAMGCVLLLRAMASVAHSTIPHITAVQMGVLCHTHTLCTIAVAVFPRLRGLALSPSLG